MDYVILYWNNRKLRLIDVFGRDLQEGDLVITSYVYRMAGSDYVKKAKIYLLKHHRTYRFFSNNKCLKIETLYGCEQTDKVYVYKLNASVKLEIYEDKDFIYKLNDVDYPMVSELEDINNFKLGDFVVYNDENYIKSNTSYGLCVGEYEIYTNGSIICFKDKGFVYNIKHLTELEKIKKEKLIKDYKIYFIKTL